MKRILNSAYLKRLSLLGSEKDIFERAERMIQLNKGISYSPTEEELLEIIMSGFRGLQTLVHFRFELKIDLHTLQTLYESKLGDIKVKKDLDPNQPYLPPNFYKLGPLGFNVMDKTEALDIHTKINNYYNWALNFYKKLREKGLCPQEAELILPQGMFTIVTWDITVQDLIKFIEENYYKSPTIYGYTAILVTEAEDVIPRIVKYLKQTKWNEFLTI